MIEATPLLLYPGIPMARFGLNDFGENKYRIIWAPSRMVVLTGREKTMTVPMYVGPHALEPVGEFWILEGWRSGYDMCRMTKEQWEADPMMLNTGPYPTRGDYVRHETLSCAPCDANIEKLITWIEEGGKRRDGENFYACRDNMEKDLRDRKNKRDALIRDSMRPFGMETFIGAGTRHRNSKTYPILKTREELGLPAEGIMKAGRGKPVIYEVPQEA
jgi:hypothetical protein